MMKIKGNEEGTQTTLFIVRRVRIQLEFSFISLTHHYHTIISLDLRRSSQVARTVYVTNGRETLRYTIHRSFTSKTSLSGFGSH